MALLAVTGYPKGPQAPAIEPRVKVVEAEIDFSVNNVDNGEWVQMITLPVKSVAVFGLIDVTTACTASVELSVGKGGGTELLTATAGDAVGETAFTNTAGVLFDNDTVDLEVTGANAVAGVVRVMVAYLDGAAMS